MKKILYIFSLILSSCIFGAYDKKLNGGFYLNALDTHEQMEIINLNDENLMFTIIEAKVFAVGQNENFIIVKQHPKKPKSDEINNSITNFYIIPLTQTLVNNLLLGPLTLKEFEQKRKEYNIEHLNFTINFTNLE